MPNLQTQSNYLSSMGACPKEGHLEKHMGEGPNLTHVKDNSLRGVRRKHSSKFNSKWKKQQCLILLSANLRHLPLADIS